MTVLLEKIKLILDLEDIEGLLALGAPEDEYMDEAQAIFEAVAKLNDVSAKTDLVLIIQKIWAKAFGLSVSEIEKRQEAFKNVAYRIMQ